MALRREASFVWYLPDRVVVHSSNSYFLRRMMMRIALIAGLIFGLALSSPANAADDGYMYVQAPRGQSIRVQASPDTSSEDEYMIDDGEVVRAGGELEKSFRKVEISTPRGSRTGYIQTQKGMTRRDAAIELGPQLEDVSGFVNTPEDEPIVVFEAPGKTTVTCKSFLLNLFGSDCSHKLEAGKEIKIIGNQLVEVADSANGEQRPHLQNYYHVVYKNEENGKSVTREGWVYSEVILTSVELASGNDNASEPICEKDAPGVAIDHKKQSEVHRLRSKIAPLSGSTDLIAEKLSSVLGKCLIDPPNVVPDFGGKQSGFDRVLENSKKTPASIAVSTGNGEVTRKQMLSIDARARTLYGEMARCLEYGSQYMLAAAAVIRNREKAIQAEPQASKIPFPYTPKDDQPLAAQVVSEPFQFSVWNSEIRSKPNPSLAQVLCPPSDPEQNFWKGHKPGSREQDIWRTALRIATEMEMDPSGFDQRTSKVTQLYYTSGVGHFHGMKRVSPDVNGARLSNRRCIELWEPKPAGAKKEERRVAGKAKQPVKVAKAKLNTAQPAKSPLKKKRH
jgi:hypothetical protein